MKDKNLSLFLVIGILVCSIGIRIYYIDDSFFSRTADDLFTPASDFVTEGVYPSGYLVMGFLGIPYGPAFVYLFSAFLWFWHDIYMLYVFSILLWVVASFFSYKTGSEFFGRHAGIIACLLSSFQSLAIFATTDNANGTFVASFEAMFIYSLFRIKIGRDPRFWILAFFSLAFLLQIHISAFGSLLILAAFFFFKPRLDIKYMAAGLALLALLFIPYFIELHEIGFSRIYNNVSEYLSTLNSAQTDGAGGAFYRIAVIDPDVQRGEPFFYVAITGLLFLLVVLINDFRKGKDPAGMKKVALLIMIFVFSYSWMTLFPYVNYYSLTFLFFIMCLVIAVFFNNIISRFRRKTPVVLLLYALLSLWALSNIGATRKILAKYGEGRSFQFQKTVARAILENEPSGSKTPLVTGEQTYFGSIYNYDTLVESVLIKILLKQENWYPTDPNVAYLIIGKEKLPFERIKSYFMEEIDERYVLIKHDQEIEGGRFSPDYHQEWYEVDFDDSEWEHVEFPVITSALKDEMLQQNDFYFRIILSVDDDSSNYCMFIATSHGLISLKEIYVNGKLINAGAAGGIRNYSYEIPNINEHVKIGNNVIGIRLSKAPCSCLECYSYYCYDGIYMFLLADDNHAAE